MTLNRPASSAAPDRNGERAPNLAVPLHRRVEIAAADELGIGDALAGVGGGMHHAVRDRQSLGRRRPAAWPPSRSEAGALPPPSRRKIMPPCEMPIAALAPPILTVRAGIAHDDAHAFAGNVDFFGHHLGDRGVEPLPAVDLAVIGDDRAVGLDGDIGIELVGVERRPRRRAVRGVAAAPNRRASQARRRARRSR